MALLGLTLARAQDSSELAKRYYDDAIRIVDEVKDGVTGEGWCWRAAFNIGHFVKGYRAFGDTAWLDYGVKYYDALIARMAEGPDGYRGWIGPYLADAALHADVHIGDAILFNGMLEFAVLVNESPQLVERYGPKAVEYVNLANKHLIEKWHARGTWYEDGEFGGYRAWDRFLTADNRRAWQQKPDARGSGLSLPFNKQNAMAIAMLRISRITGQKPLRDRARKIFAFLRSRFHFHDGHVTWCYWEPLGPFDIEPDGARARHWMNTHPYRNYQAGEVAEIVEAYHYGIVFDETDLRAILNTNLKVMFNGDFERPAFRNSNVRLPGYVEAPPSREYPTRAGCLWTSLADFDETIRRLAQTLAPAGDSPRAAVERAYLEKVVLTAPVSFDRRRVRELRPSELGGFADGEAAAIVVRCVLPSTLAPDAEAWIVSKVSVGGELVTELLSEEGQRLAELDRAQVEGGMDGHAGVRIVRWKPRNAGGGPLPPGAYRVRWSLDGASREFRIRVNEPAPTGRGDR